MPHYNKALAPSDGWNCGKNQRHHKKLIADDNPDVDIDESSLMVQLFRRFASHLDQKHDKYERLVKLSRDVTIESKRIIFLLHRISSFEDQPNVLTEAYSRLVELENSTLRKIAVELVGEDPFQFLRGFTAGLQEYIEALSFYFYIKEHRLIQWVEVQERLTFPESKQGVAEQCLTNKTRRARDGMTHGCMRETNIVKDSSLAEAENKEGEDNRKETVVENEHENFAEAGDCQMVDSNVMEVVDSDSVEYSGGISGSASAANADDTVAEQGNNVETVELIGTTEAVTDTRDNVAEAEEVKSVQKQTYTSIGRRHTVENTGGNIDRMAEGAALVVAVPQSEYILGLADLTGELMRKCITAVSSGQFDVCFELCEVLRSMYDGFTHIGNTGPKEVKRKAYTLKQSLAKVERACYTLQVRGSEIPRHMLVGLFSDAGTRDEEQADIL